MHRRVKLQGVGPAARSARPRTAPSTTSASPSRAPWSTDGTSSNARRDWNAKLALCRSRRDPGTSRAVPASPSSRGRPTVRHRPQRRDRRLRPHPRPGRRRRRHPGERVRAQARDHGQHHRVQRRRVRRRHCARAPEPLNIPPGQLLNANRLDNQNDDVLIALQPDPRQRRAPMAGGLAIYNGAERYVVERQRHLRQLLERVRRQHLALRELGRPGAAARRGRILGNRVFANDAFDSGGGIMIAGSIRPGSSSRPWFGPCRRRAELHLAEPLERRRRRHHAARHARVSEHAGLENRHRSNMITNNAATDIGGGMTIDDAHNVLVINNTFARNASTDTSEDRNFLPNGAGFVSEKNTLDAGFSVPVAFFNNIFWNNEAFTFDPTDTDRLVSAGMIDLEVYGTPGTLQPALLAPHRRAPTRDHAPEQHRRTGSGVQPRLRHAHLRWPRPRDGRVHDDARPRRPAAARRGRAARRLPHRRRLAGEVRGRGVSGRLPALVSRRRRPGSAPAARSTSAPTRSRSLLMDALETSRPGRRRRRGERPGPAREDEQAGLPQDRRSRRRRPRRAAARSRPLLRAGARAAASSAAHITPSLKRRFVSTDGFITLPGRPDPMDLYVFGFKEVGFDDS